MQRGAATKGLEPACAGRVSQVRVRRERGRGGVLRSVQIEGTHFQFQIGPSYCDNSSNRDHFTQFQVRQFRENKPSQDNKPSQQQTPEFSP